MLLLLLLLCFVSICKEEQSLKSIFSDAQRLLYKQSYVQFIKHIDKQQDKLLIKVFPIRKQHNGYGIICFLIENTLSSNYSSEFVARNTALYSHASKKRNSRRRKQVRNRHLFCDYHRLRDPLLQGVSRVAETKTILEYIVVQYTTNKSCIRFRLLSDTCCSKVMRSIVLKNISYKIYDLYIDWSTPLRSESLTTIVEFNQDMSWLNVTI